MLIIGSLNRMATISNKNVFQAVINTRRNKPLLSKKRSSQKRKPARPAVQYWPLKKVAGFALSLCILFYWLIHAVTQAFFNDLNSRSSSPTFYDGTTISNAIFFTPGFLLLIGIIAIPLILAGLFMFYRSKFHSIYFSMNALLFSLWWGSFSVVLSLSNGVLDKDGNLPATVLIKLLDIFPGFFPLVEESSAYAIKDLVLTGSSILTIYISLIAIKIVAIKLFSIAQEKYQLSRPKD